MMMIIILYISILFNVQAQYLDDEYSSDKYTTVRNENVNVADDLNISTILPNLFSSMNDFDLTTSFDQTNENLEEQWYNFNQTRRKDSIKSVLYWKRTDGNQQSPSTKGISYMLTSDRRCMSQMCTVQLKYNGTISNRLSGCLSFSLQTRGQPVGQIWIVEDKEQDNNSQRIQLINKTLHIQHSLRSKIKNLSITTNILFRHAQKDALILSNLKVNWRGSCPKSRRIPTPSPHLIDRRATIDDNYFTWSSESSGATSEDFQTSQSYLIDDTTTIRTRHRTSTKRPFSLMNQKNFGWFMSLIGMFCMGLILLTTARGFWLIRRYHQFTWHLAAHSPIQIIARRSLRSSTRSEKQIATISQLATEIFNNDLQKEQTDISVTDSDRSIPNSYYTYL